MNAPALFETMAYGPAHGVARLDRHLSRLARSADVLGHRHDDTAIRDTLFGAVQGIAEARRVRLTLAFDGEVLVDLTPLPPKIEQAVVAIVPLPVAPDDYRLRHKTVDRDFYDKARTAANAFEVVFVDSEGQLTEGSFTNLFVLRGDVLATPPLERGLLPGVLRAELIDTGRAVEADVTPTDLARGFFIGNALRGLIPATIRD